MIFNNKKTAFARATQIISRRQHPVSAGRSSQIRRKFRSGRRSRNTERNGTGNRFSAAGNCRHHQRFFRRIGQTLRYGHFESRRRQRPAAGYGAGKMQSTAMVQSFRTAGKPVSANAEFSCRTAVGSAASGIKKTVDDSSFSVLLWQYYAIIFHSQKGGRLLVATIYSESRP